MHHFSHTPAPTSLHRHSVGQVHAKPALSISSTTGPLSHLKNRQVLVLVDAENLMYSARTIGKAVSFQRIATLLAGASKACKLHAFLSVPPDRPDARLTFFQEPWSVHTNFISHVRTGMISKRRANADNFILFHAGSILTQKQSKTIDTVIIGSGDGDLADDLAAAILQLKGACNILTMSLAGSTSQRLNATSNEKFCANIEVGMDCLLPTDRTMNQAMNIPQQATQGRWRPMDQILRFVTTHMCYTYPK